jgi:hypothetical protein
MSQDVILGSTDRSWSRGESQPLTDKEKDRIEKLANLEMLATHGDVAARKKMVEVNAAIAVIQKKAKKGDTKSQRILSTLQDSGLLTLSESSKGPKLVVAGFAGRTRRSTQPSSQAQQANPTQQVQDFLLNLKMRAMAGDPQAVAILQRYQQIITPASGGQPEGSAPQGTQNMQLNSSSPGSSPEGYPSTAPMTGEASDERRQERREKIRILKERAAAGDTEAITALQIWKQHRAERKARQSSSDGSFVGFNGHLAFIRGLDLQGDAFIQGLGEEEVALAREGGACERAALRRR